MKITKELVDTIGKMTIVEIKEIFANGARPEILNVGIEYDEFFQLLRNYYGSRGYTGHDIGLLCIAAIMKIFAMNTRVEGQNYGISPVEKIARWWVPFMERFKKKGIIYLTTLTSRERINIGHYENSDEYLGIINNIRHLTPLRDNAKM